MTSSSAQATPFAPWLWVVAVLWSALVVGAGLWIAVSTGQWIAVLLALGLAAPIDVMLIRRWSRVNKAHSGL